MASEGRLCAPRMSGPGFCLWRRLKSFLRRWQRAAIMYSLMVTAKMNDVDPQARLVNVLARIAEHPVQRIHELLPWNWRSGNPQADQAA
jgi:hypothetical protein